MDSVMVANVFGTFSSKFQSLLLSLRYLKSDLIYKCVIEMRFSCFHSILETEEDSKMKSLFQLSLLHSELTFDAIFASRMRIIIMIIVIISIIALMIVFVERDYFF
ncbi:Chondroitin proteoglycan-2 [Sarcoptes scabiei]|nr:Chondroitin proteoglycan-2 [Sarcoptes scabiei]